MKKIIRVNDLCCEACAKQMAKKLLLVDGVLNARANFMKNMIFVEVRADLEDKALEAVFEGTDMEVLSIERRKGLFG